LHTPFASLGIKVFDILVPRRLVFRQIKKAGMAKPRFSGFKSIPAGALFICSSLYKGFHNEEIVCQCV
jgi:hypothetical protein